MEIYKNNKIKTKSNWRNSILFFFLMSYQKLNIEYGQFKNLVHASSEKKVKILLITHHHPNPKENK